MVPLSASRRDRRSKKGYRLDRISVLGCARFGRGGWFVGCGPTSSLKSETWEVCDLAEGRPASLRCVFFDCPRSAKQGDKFRYFRGPNDWMRQLPENASVIAPRSRCHGVNNRKPLNLVCKY